MQCIWRKRKVNQCFNSWEYFIAVANGLQALHSTTWSNGQGLLRKSVKRGRLDKRRMEWDSNGGDPMLAKSLEPCLQNYWFRAVWTQLWIRSGKGKFEGSGSFSPSQTWSIAGSTQTCINDFASMGPTRPIPQWYTEPIKWRTYKMAAIPYSLLKATKRM